MMKSSERVRRTHSPEFKAKLLTECLRPGGPIAAIATHQINDKLLRYSLRSATGKEPSRQPKKATEAPPRIFPVQVAFPVEPMPFVRIHIQQARRFIWNGLWRASDNAVTGCEVFSDETVKARMDKGSQKAAQRTSLTARI